MLHNRASRVSLLACLTPLLAISTGCATLFASGPDHIPVQSNPPGAKVLVDNIQVGVTPMVVSLDRKNSHGTIRVEAPGFEPYVTQRNKSFQAVAILNCLGLVPWVVDLVTGNYEAFDSTNISVSLVPAGGGAPGMPTPPVVVPPNPLPPNPLPPNDPSPPASGLPGLR